MTANPLPPEHRFVVETNAGTDKNPIIKHRLVDAHSAPSPRNNLRQRVIDGISQDEAKMANFSSQFAALGVPALREDAEPLTYHEWCQVDELIAQYEPMASTEQRETYKTMVAELSSAMYGDHTWTVEVCCMLDCYNIDPRIPLLTSGRVAMGMDMAGELIAHFDMTTLDSGIPDDGVGHGDAFTPDPEPVEELVIEDTAPAEPEVDVAPTPAPQEPAQEPSTETAPATAASSVPAPAGKDDVLAAAMVHSERVAIELVEIIDIIVRQRVAEAIVKG